MERGGKVVQAGVDEMLLKVPPLSSFAECLCVSDRLSQPCQTVSAHKQFS